MFGGSHPKWTQRETELKSFVQNAHTWNLHSFNINYMTNGHTAYKTYENFDQNPDYHIKKYYT